MADLKLEHIYKVYPNGVKAVNDFTMDIKDQEFIVFVGPSGCGKSTTLRMIAGLEDITAGELYIGDQIVNDMEPKDRDIAMVFQNYALYPHMTVYENMAFGLKLRHMPNDEIHERVMWAADVLGLKEYLDRKPKAMSGGQRQRVALGRAILRNPKVMLLDEPLSNLDAKLRSQMRSEISKLHQKLKTTFIYVTHDQVEAMTLGTRVVVMKLGRIQQIDTPKNLYDYPGNKFVAGFIGTPQMNFFEARLTKEGDVVHTKFEYTDSELDLPYTQLIKVKSSYLDGSKKVYVGLRCEDISIDPEVIKGKKNLIDVKVSHFEELGNETLIYGDLNMQGEGFDETSTRVIIKASGRGSLAQGDIVKAYFNMDKAHFFDYDSEETIKPRIPNDNLVDIEIKNNTITLCDEKLALPSAISVKEFKGSILLPISAINLETKGITAKVSNVELINGTYLIYLLVNNKTLFTTSTKEYKVGDEISFGIDFSQIEIKENNEVLQEKIPEFDNFKANFYNFKTAFAATNSEEFAKEKDERTKVVSEKYDKLKEELEAKFNEEITKANALNYEEIKVKNNELLASETSRLNNELKLAKEEYVKSIKEINKEHKVNIKKIKSEIKETYEKRISEENANYKEVLSTNKDRDVILLRKRDHTLFKENLPKERANDLENKLSSEALAYDAKKSSITSKFKRLKNTNKLELKELKQKIARENNLVEVLNKEHTANLAKLEKERSEELAKVEMIFFFKLQVEAQKYALSPDTITNKLIQGLGSKVFSRVYEIKVPHDAYKLDNEGYSVTVKEILDYGIKKFIKCSFEDKEIYVETTKDYKVGDTLNLSIDYLKTQIIETGMNIRLY